MRVFVGEFLCGGGMASTPEDQISSSLLCEGLAMWRALVTDFAEWAQVVTPIDPRLNLRVDRMPDSVVCIPLRSGENVREQWLAIAKSCDIALVVAPETDDELGGMIQTFREAGVDVLAADLATLRMASDKWLTAKWLMEHAIPTPQTWAMESKLTASEARRPNGIGPIGLDAKRWVRKPRDGCGSDSIVVFDDWKSACSSMTSNDLVQAWIEGRPASVLVLGGAIEVSNRVICPAVWQHCQLRKDDSGNAIQTDVCTVCYTGGSGPIENELQMRVVSLAEQVTRALPEPLRGFLGIDVVLGDRMEYDCVIEINPRLTTSYIGVRQMFNENLTSIWNPSAVWNPDTSGERRITGRQLRVGTNQIRWTSEGDVQIEPPLDGDF